MRNPFSNASKIRDTQERLQTYWDDSALKERLQRYSGIAVDDGRCQISLQEPLLAVEDGKPLISQALIAKVFKDEFSPRISETLTVSCVLDEQNESANFVIVSKGEVERIDSSTDSLNQARNVVDQWILALEASYNLPSIADMLAKQELEQKSKKSAPAPRKS